MTRYLAGAAYVQVLPSLRTFQKVAATELKSVDVKAVARVVPEVDKQAASKAADDVQALADKLDKARKREADATGAVRVAEEKLTEARTKGNTTAAQLAAAEERLAKATRAAADAKTTATRAAKALESAQRRNTAAMDEFEASAKRGTSALARLWQQGDGVDGMARSLANARREALGFAGGAFQAASTVTAIGSAVPAVTALGGALGTAAGAALILPGALVAGGTAVAALKVGVSGLGEAFKAAAEGDAKKLAEATAKLAPPAREVVGEYVRMQPAIKALKLDVQGRLFAGVAAEVRSLGVDYLPMVRIGLVQMAGNFNAAAKEAGGFLRQQQTMTDVPLIFDRSSVAMRNLVAAVQPLLSALRDVVAVGVTVLADVTGGAGNAAASFAAFIAQARATGQIEAWIRRGFEALQQFGQVLGNIGSIFSAVFRAAQESSGGGLLGTVIAVTGAVSALLSSAQGQTALTALFTTLHDTVQNLLPGVQAVVGAVFSGVTALGPEVPALAAAFSVAAVAVAPLVTMLAQLAAAVLPPLVALFSWLAPALPAIAVGFAAGALALKGYMLVSTIIRLYQMWTAGQIALNIAMSANPIGLIVIAIAALVGAIVWIATQTTWFQDLWAVVWGAIQKAAVWAWENALKPAFDGIVTAFKAIGAAASWLWTTILKPLFDGIAMVVKVAAAILITAFILPAVLAFKLLAAAGTWLWENVLQPVFTAIGVAASWLWNNVLSPVIGYVIAYVQAWGAIFSWLWTNAISPALAAIGTAFSWLWTNVIQPVGAAIGTAVGAVGAAFAFVWHNVIQPAWNALGAAISAVWETLIRPVFDALKSAVSTIGAAFDIAVNGIKSAWDRVYDILSTPIKWIIDVVYNNGIREVWNKVAGLVGLDPLGPISFGGGTAAGGGRPMQHMAGGGVLAGYAPGVDSVPALLSPGEAVLVPELVRAIGPATILAANAAASGRPPGGTGGYAGGGLVQRFAGGGIVDSLLGWVPGLGDVVKSLWSDPIGFLRRQVGDVGEWATLLAKTPAKLISSGAETPWNSIKGFFGFSSDEAAAAAGAAGGSPMGWQQMWNIIRAQFPSATLNSDYRPGDPGYHGKGRAIDIGGPMGAINSWIAKVYPNSTQLIYTPGANILNGRPFTYDGPTQSDHYDHVHWAFDSGGYLPPGYNTVYNGTGRPEPVLTDQQWRSLENAGSGGQFTGNLYLDGGGFLGAVRGEIEAYDQDSADALLRGNRI